MLRLSDSDLASLHGEPAPPDRVGCLDSATLADLAAGTLSAPQREEAALHLSRCRDCAEEYNLLGEVREWAEDVAGAPVSLAHGPSPEPRSYGWALAASMALPLLALTLWQRNEIERLRARPLPAPVTRVVERPSEEQTRRIAELESEARELAQPRINVPIIDLQPDLLRGDSGAQTIEVPSAATFFNVILNVGEPGRYGEYGIEVFDAGGRSVWRSRGLKKTAYETFTIALPRQLFPAGRYRVELAGIDPAGNPRPVQRYDVTIRYR